MQKIKILPYIGAYPFKNIKGKILQYGAILSIL